MAIFKIAMNNVFNNENEYVEHTRDVTNLSNYGITLRFLQAINKDSTKETLKNLQKNEIEDIYFKYIWIPNNYQNIDSQNLANKIFDTAVNVGSKMANKFLQEAVNFYDAELTLDGIFHEDSIKIINRIYADHEEKIMIIYKLLQKEYYGRVLINRPEQAREFGTWVKRAEY